RRQGHGRAQRGDYIDLQSDQLCGQFGKPVELSLGPSIFQDNVATLDVSQLPQPFSHSLDQRLGRRAGLQNAEAPYLPRRLLRTPRERPRRHRAAEKREEIAAVQSDTPSATEQPAGE